MIVDLVKYNSVLNAKGGYDKEITSRVTDNIEIQPSSKKEVTDLFGINVKNNIVWICGKDTEVGNGYEFEFNGSTYRIVQTDRYINHHYEAYAEQVIK